MKDISRIIHGVDNVYEGFVPQSKDLQGWGGHREFFQKMIELTNPKLIAEVGTWKGRSACSMGQILKDQGRNNTSIVCVDTWLGATEMWTNHEDKKRFKSLNCENGYPTLYKTFISNVIHEGLTDIIVPFPQTSTNAARFFEKKNLSPELIYIDASHEYEDVVQDLEVWSRVLKKGGLIFGDDYCQHWEGVIDAVDEFSWDNDLEVSTFRFENEEGAPSDYWVLSRDRLDLEF